MSQQVKLDALEEAVAKCERLVGGFRRIDDTLRQFPPSARVEDMLGQNAATLASAERSLTLAREALEREMSTAPFGSIPRRRGVGGRNRS